MDSTQLILIAGFFLIALVYASVGFGGGSSYIALLGQPFLSIASTEVKSTALLCNIIVVAGGTWLFYKAEKLDLKKSLPFVAASIPLAYLGALIALREKTFFIILAVSLILAAILLWIQPSVSRNVRSQSQVLNASIGGGVGFLSGLVGIGGGIFLSPLLHLINWDDAKKISALASLFILVNSVSGLAGHIQRSASINWEFILPLAISVLIGGQIGSRLGVRKFNPIHIKRVTAVLIFAAGLNILKDYV